MPDWANPLKKPAAPPAGFRAYSDTMGMGSRHSRDEASAYCVLYDAPPRPAHTVCRVEGPLFTLRSILRLWSYRLGLGHDSATDKLARINRETKTSAPLLPPTHNPMTRPRYYHPIVLPIQGSAL